MRCQRCGGPASSWTMSRFNTDLIYIGCDEVERRHPSYDHAREVELRRVQGGDLNYPGIGCPEELRRPG